MNKKESKYFSTAAKMDKALIELLAKKDFEYITVKEICAKAGVNRSTFYLHYQNTTDLLHETTRYVIDGFLAYFSVDGNHSFNAQAADKNDLIFVRAEYVMPYLSYIKENQQIFKTSLARFGVMGFEACYDRMFRHVFDPILDRFGVPNEKRQYVIKFYISGTTAIVMEWLKNGCREPIEKISDIIIECAGRLI